MSREFNPKNPSSLNMKNVPGDQKNIRAKELSMKIFQNEGINFIET